MRIIPCLRGVPVEHNGYGAVQPSGAPIMQLKELEPDWGRYNAWRHSLQEPYWDWRNRIFRHREQIQKNQTEKGLLAASAQPR
ncbi:MAG: hypothetical protein L0Z50_04190 [Verrucomicrobiales bacterium]|nr:hypothetical protein [Verrucomicrobiales bacterium]